MDAMAKSRKFLKNTAQQIYEDEVKNCCYKSLTRAGGEFWLSFERMSKNFLDFMTNYMTWTGEQ
jgi:hypothetical protein